MDSMLAFLRKVLSEDVDLQSVTKAKLRERYMEENGLSEMNKEEKKQFSSAVNSVLIDVVLSDSSVNTSQRERSGEDSDFDSSKNISGKSQSNSSGADSSMDQNESDDADYEKTGTRKRKKPVNSSGDIKSKKLKINTVDSEEETTRSPSKKSSAGPQKKHLSTWSDESNSGPSLSESEEETPIKSGKQTRTKQKRKKLKIHTSDSEEEIVCPANKRSSAGAQKGLKTKRPARNPGNKRSSAGAQKGHLSKEYDESSSGPSLIQSEEETLIKSGRETKMKQKTKKFKVETSDSEDEPLSFQKTEQNLSSCKNGKTDSNSSLSPLSDDENELSSQKPFVKKQKKEKVERYSSDSENETLAFQCKKPQISVDKARASKTTTVSIMGNDESRSNSSESDGDAAAQKQKSKQKEKKQKTKSEKGKKSSSASDDKIEHLKKYLRTAGMHVQSYTKLFENCKSKKSKVEKLLGLLQKEGLKGRPTLEKCKKLKKKIERKKEIAELDVSNIIATEGRPRRAAYSAETKREKTPNKSPKKKFSRLLDIIDSEGSD